MRSKMSASVSRCQTGRSDQSLLDRAGDYWWLELNPNGQWGWLETETGLAMSSAFADLLAQGDRR
ncbi:hypothetical protein GCM10023100_53930 [Actinocorallia cavernae]|uniref:Uncharacterized protein n=2 Tax=Actinomycetes TaxID=1760 RepID=A0ABP5Y7N9_9ACTN